MENLSLEEKLILQQKLLNNSFIFLQNLNANLNEGLKKNLTQSVIDLLNCYICLEKVEDPLLCPQCNNFACKKCLKDYYGQQTRKKCCMCKQEIKFSDLRENKIIKEMQNILSTDKSQKTAVDEFAKVIKEKKEFYNEQKKEINDIINGFNNYKTCLEKYKIEFNEYLMQCKNIVEKTFDDYYKTIQNLIKNLSSYDKIYQKSIEKYDNIYNKVKENCCDSQNIKDFINDILYLERKQMKNDDKLESQKFLLRPITFKPNFKNYCILANKILNKLDVSINFEFNSQNLGKCFFIIGYISNNKIYSCQLRVKTKKVEYERCFLIKLCKKGDSARDFILKQKEKNGLEYLFECNIEEKNLFTPNEMSLKFNLDVLEMDTFNN